MRRPFGTYLPLKSQSLRLVNVLAFLAVVASAIGAPTGPRTTILVPLTDKPSWRDAVFLAAVPAACAANKGGPSLIALDEKGSLGPEISDYAARYRPQRAYTVGGDLSLTFGGLKAVSMKADSAEEAALALSKAFWQRSKTAVVCLADDYDSALVASPLAALLKAPLLLVGAQGFGKDLEGELQRLGVRELVAVGFKPARFAGDVVPLDGPSEIMAWTQRKGIAVKYLAAVNPLDRSGAVVKKLSLSGALLAAGRGGLVAPLKFAVKWKQPFDDEPAKTAIPQGVNKGTAPTKAGKISFGLSDHPFFLTGDDKEQNLKLWVDTGGGTYEGPFVSGDTVEIEGKKCAVSLGTRTGFGKSDVHLTWPTADRLCQELRGYYRALGSPPDSLCLVGFPDAIPQAIVGHGGIVEEQTSDLPYANANEDPFAEIGVGRVVAENVSFATLYASRVLTYREILSADWEDRACQARWENTFQPLFENVGFESGYLHKTEDVPWAVAPAEGKPGTRAASFGPESRLAHCAAFTHADHSWWRELGATFRWDADVLIAPAVVESGGCSTASLDREADYRSVVARLFRLGATAFAGNSREGCAEQELQRQEFWNGVLAGESIGQAHRRSINSALLTVQDHKEGPGGIYRYSLNIRMQFGDPAFKMRVPTKPRSAPARTELKDNVVSVYAPARWWPVKIVVPADWKAWADKDLYVVRGAGAYAQSDWCADGYNLEKMLVTAEFTTKRRVTAIEQVHKTDAPLGWTGNWYGQDNPDGTHTYRFAVRFIDFDQVKGKTRSSVARLDYRLTFE
jgi:hypothetical protein